MDTLEFLSHAVNRPEYPLSLYQTWRTSNSCAVSDQQQIFGRRFLNILKGVS
jgi:hypothetical protein